MFGLLNEAEQKGSMDPDDYARRRGRFYLLWNCVKNSGRPMLSALMAGRAAHEVETTDTEALLKEVMEKLRSTFAPQVVPAPLEVIVTRWKRDPFARGTYSFVGPQTEPGDYDVMAAPVGNLYFAGEATCGTHPATVHGAYLSGLRAASEVVESMIGDIGVPEPLVLPKPVAASAEKFHGLREAPVDVSPSDQSPRRLKSSPSKAKPRVEPAPAVTSHVSHINPYRSSANSRATQDEEYEASIIGAILYEIGERPVKPGRPGVNPFLLYTNDVWSKCKEDLAGDGTTKATRNEIRTEVGRQWRMASDGEKQPYLERCEAAQRCADEARAAYEKSAAKWDTEARRVRLAFIKANPPAVSSGIWTTGTSIEAPANRRRTAVDYAELTDGE